MEKDEGNEDMAGVAAAPTQQQQQASCTRAELTELVRAIKFSKPDASMRAVHREITQDLSQKDGFEFLANIPLNDVKKVWKKAVTSASQQQQQQQQQVGKNEDEEKVMKLYTVGDATVRTLAHEYSQAAAAQAAAQAGEEEAATNAMMENYVHVFLDQPGDRSGSRPHQALINFGDNHTEEAEAASPGNTNYNGSNIVKIQVAASTPGDTTPHPMLLYNASRSLKTFVHPDPNDDGYQRIRTWIEKKGASGALGSMGGTKAYFYGRVTKQKKGPNVISIDVSRLAPTQDW